MEKFINDLIQSIDDLYHHWYKEHEKLFTDLMILTGSDPDHPRISVYQLVHNVVNHQYPFRLSDYESLMENDFINKYGNTATGAELIDTKKKNEVKMEEYNNNPNNDIEKKVYGALIFINDPVLPLPYPSELLLIDEPFILKDQEKLDTAIPSIIKQINNTPLLSPAPPISMEIINQGVLRKSTVACIGCGKELFDSNDEYEIENIDGLPVAKECSGCNIAYYCSSQCQNNDLINHKEACRMVSDVRKEKSKISKDDINNDAIQTAKKGKENESKILEDDNNDDGPLLTELEEWIGEKHSELACALHSVIKEYNNNKKETIIDSDNTIFRIIIGYHKKRAKSDYPLFTLEQITPLSNHKTINKSWEETKRELLSKIQIMQKSYKINAEQFLYIAVLDCSALQLKVDTALLYASDRMFANSSYAFIKDYINNNHDPIMDARNAIRAQREKEKKNQNHSLSNNHSSSSSSSSAAVPSPSSSSFSHRCLLCGMDKEKSEYSKSQWKSKKYQCIDCLKKKEENERQMKEGENKDNQNNNNNVKASNGKNEAKNIVENNNGNDGGFECAVCLEDESVDEISSICTQSEKHRLHRSCFLQLRLSCKKFGKELLCSFCRAPMKEI